METRASVEDEKQAMLDEFAMLGEWMERYEYIIELGKKLPGLDDARHLTGQMNAGSCTQLSVTPS